VKELYDGIIKVFKELTFKHEAAMSICQSLGYNGFKRRHRRRSKKFLCLEIALANELFDNYRKQVGLTSIPGTYSASSLQEHLAAWDHVLETNIIALIDLSKQFFDRTGLMNRHVKTALCCLQKDREKIRRWYARFTESNWSSIDTHCVDDALHEHEKKKEEGGNARKTHVSY
jgi:hypothetical protein